MRRSDTIRHASPIHSPGPRTHGYVLGAALLLAVLLPACGGSGGSGGGTANSAPAAGDITLTTFEENTVSGSVPGWDPDGDALRFAIATPAASGVAVITNADAGAFSYTPAAGSAGTDSFTVSVSDGVAAATSTVTVHINAIPLLDHTHAPSASAITISTGLDQPFTGTLPASDVDGHALTFSIVTGAADGTAMLTDANTGAFTYEPNAGFAGADGFTFRVTDGMASAQADVTIYVTADPLPVHNHPPVAFPLVLTTDEDMPFSAFFPAADVDGDPITFSIAVGGTLGDAVLTDSATGAFTYTPRANLNGPDSVTFRAEDGMGNALEAVLQIDVRPVNDLPVVTAPTVVLDEDVPFTGTIAAVDVDGDPVTFSLTRDGVIGSVALTPSTGGFVYTPNLNVSGADSFALTATDGSGVLIPVEVAVTIRPVNDPPVPVWDLVFFLPNNRPGSGMVGASDVEGDPLSYSLYRNPDTGTVTFPDPASPTFTFTPTDNFLGTYPFWFTVSDTGGPPRASGRAYLVLEWGDTHKYTWEEASRPAISGNGRYLAYTEYNWTQARTRVRLVDAHDPYTPTPQPAAFASNGSYATRISFPLDISDDGRYTTLYSEDMLTADTLTWYGATFVFDRVMNWHTLVATGRVNAGLPNLGVGAVVSNNGRYVAFTTPDPIVPEDTNFRHDVYLRDFRSGTTILLSRNAAGKAVTGSIFGITGNGRYVTFTSIARDLLPSDRLAGEDSYVYDRITGTTELLCGQEGVGTMPVLSEDGTVAFVVQGTAPNLQVMACDRLTRTYAPVSYVGTPITSLQPPQLSQNGRYLAFLTPVAHDLLDTNGNPDWYILDRTTGAVALGSVSAAGGVGSGSAFRASLSADGRKLFFESDSPDLTLNDTNGVMDVFVADNALSDYDPNADDDGDGLTNNREAGGTGTYLHVADTDGDGVNDGAEVAAGTDPLDAASF